MFVAISVVLNIALIGFIAYDKFYKAKVNAELNKGIAKVETDIAKVESKVKSKF